MIVSDWKSIFKRELYVLGKVGSFIRLLWKLGFYLYLSFIIYLKYILIFR